MNTMYKMFMCRFFDFTLAADNHFALCKKMAGLNELIRIASDARESAIYECQKMEAAKLATPWFDMMKKIHNEISPFIDSLLADEKNSKMVNENAYAYHMLLKSMEATQN